MWLKLTAAQEFKSATLLTVINICCIEFTFLIIHMYVQQTFMESPRPAVHGTDTGEQRPCLPGAPGLPSCSTRSACRGGAADAAGPGRQASQGSGNPELRAEGVKPMDELGAVGEAGILPVRSLSAGGSSIN